MQAFKDTDKQYNVEYHLYEMVEAIKQLSKDDLQELANASPVFEDAVHLTNKLVKYQAEQFEALVQEVAPMQKLSYGVDSHGKEGKILIVADAPINIPMPRQEHEVTSLEDIGCDNLVYILKDSPGNVINFKHTEQCEEFLDYCRESEDIEAYFDAIHVVNKNWGNFVWGIKKAKQIDYNLSIAKAEEEESEQTKPIFKEVSIDLKPTEYLDYTGMYSNDDAEIQNILPYIEQNNYVCVHAHIYLELRKKLKGKKYLFCQSKSNDELLVWIWKAQKESEQLAPKNDIKFAKSKTVPCISAYNADEYDNYDEIISMFERGYLIQFFEKENFNDFKRYLLNEWESTLNKKQIEVKYNSTVGKRGGKPIYCAWIIP